MSDNTPKNDIEDFTPTPMNLALSAREQEVFDLLLTGAAPKEIGYKLNISYDTVLSHQKNLYRKLDIHSIDELLNKFSNAMNEKNSPQGTTAVFSDWFIVKDDFGSSANLTTQIEFIRGQHWTIYTFFGELMPPDISYGGAIFHPNPPTLEIMKKMKLLSLTVLGDGQSYEVKLSTTEIRLNDTHNYYQKIITPPKGEISTIHIYINELSQSPFYPGESMPFVQDNIELFFIQSHSKGEFNLKILDISFYI